MRKSLLILALSFCLSAMSSAQTQTFYDFSWPTINGDTISMSQYAGKKVMVVNVASYCAYTPEYRPLNQLDSLYGPRYHFAVIGFPCNDFANQGGTDSAIIATCHSYHVNFQIMFTVKCVTGDTAPLYKWLERADLNGVATHGITWNFNKFLIDRQGHWYKWYDSAVNPEDTAIVNWIVSDSAAVPAGFVAIDATPDPVKIKSADPANTNIALELNSNASQNMDVNLYTIDGKLVSNIYSGEVAGTKEINYSVLALPSGIYLIHAKSESMDKTLKCVVQH